MAEEFVRVAVENPSAKDVGALPADEPERAESRFYENAFPEVHELVMVNVRSIAEMGAYVSLLEYNNIEGMILLSELSRRRIRSINKLIRVGKNEIVMVLRVDKEKGYIDLSKRRVSPEDVAKCEERFNKAKCVHSVLRQTAQACGSKLEELYHRLGWPCYRKYRINVDDEEPNAKPQYMHAYDVFKMAFNDRSIFDEYDITEEEKEALFKYIERRMAPQAIRIRADVEVTCFNYEGIDAIKAALSAGEKSGNSTEDDCQVKIRLIAPPLYVITTTAQDKQKGLDTLNNAIEVVRQTITTSGGSITVKMEPKVVSQHDERELTLMMERLQMENREMDDGPEDD